MFKRAVISLSGLFFAAFAFCQNPLQLSQYDSEAGMSMRAHLEEFCADRMQGRKAGTSGEVAAAEYFEKALQEAGVELVSPEGGEIFGLKSQSGDTLVSRNVYGCISGYDPQLKNRYIVIGARLDNLGVNERNVNGVSDTQVFTGANGNASGLAMLLELANRLQTNSVLLRRSVIIAAFGASVPMQAGSWYFLNGGFPKASSIDAMINLDMLGTCKQTFYAYTCSNQDMNNVLSRLSGTLQPIQPKLVGLEPCASDHRSFYNNRIPSILFTTGMYPEYNSVKDLPEIINYPDMERELEYIYNYSVSLANGPKPDFNQTDELKKKKVESSGVVPYSDCDVPPTFLGSSEPSSFLINWVYVYLRYPESCVQEGVQGRVLVDFIINEKGKMTDARVVKGVDPRLDEEALRVVRSSPDWKPGKVRGRKVKSEVSMYVEFKLKRNKKQK